MKQLILVLFIYCGVSAFAVDSTRIDTSYHHNRKRAALFSTIIPGMGQIYNEFGHRKVQGRAHISWWRAPLYLGGLGFTGYMAYTNGAEASRLKKEWLHRQETGSFLYGDLAIYDDNDLINSTKTGGVGFNGFTARSKFRDFSVLGFVLIYSLNIVDAFVDSHFVTFDVSQNLTLSFHPKMYSPRDYGVGLKLSFN